jgi:sarcosine dehydrogenase
VVVLGGGVSGTSALYHLAKKGIKATLLEEDLLTAGTTWHSAGLFWSLRPNDVEIELLGRTYELVKSGGELEKATGQITFDNNGALFLASTRERLDEYKRLATIGKFYQVESHIISPEECKKMYPLMATDDLQGALFSPSDGLIDPSGITQAYAKGAKQLGAQIREKSKVKGLEITNGKIQGVHLESGEFIQTNTVVNALGAWSSSFGAQNLAPIPLVTLKHAYVVTEPIPNLGKLPNIRDHDLSIYIKWQGESLAIGGYELNPSSVQGIEKKPFNFSLYDLDWDVFEQNLNNHILRVPSLANAGIAHTVCGPESFTPDHKPLIGPHPDVQGLWCFSGFNSAGIMLSGGAGHELAQWMAAGHPSLDMYGYDIARFWPGASAKWIQDRSQEAYEKNYAIVYPHDQALVGRNARHTPFHNELIAANGVHSEVLGWERSLYFADEMVGSAEDPKFAEYLEHELTFEWSSTTMKNFKREHLHTRNAVSLFDMSAFGKIEISGPNAKNFIDYLSTQFAPEPSRAVYTHFLNAHTGEVEADLTISNLGDSKYYLVSGSGNFYHFQRHVKKEFAANQDRLNLKDVSVKNLTDDIGVLSIQGRHAQDIMKDLSGIDEFTVGDFPFSTVKKIKTRSGIPVTVIRITFVGESGFEVHCAAKDGPQLYREIHEVGRAYDLKNAGYGAIESLSMEKGYRHWHGDLRSTDTPMEASMSWIVKKKLDSDVDFCGKQALLNQKMRKRLVYVTIEPDAPAVFGLEVVRRNGEIVGYLRRACFSFSLGRPLGIAYLFQEKMKAPLKKGVIESGDYDIEILNERYPCKITLGIPFDPKNRRVVHHDYQ